MSKFKIVDRDKHTAVVFDEKADRTFIAAIGPIQRLQALTEIQDNPACSPFDLAIGLGIARHVNGKTGFAKVKQGTIAKESGVCLRTVEKRLKELGAVHGHIAQIRQGPNASIFFLVIKEPYADTVLKERENRIPCGSDKPLSDLSEDQRTASDDTKNRTSCGQEPHFDASVHYTELSDLTQRSNSAGAPSRRQRASSAHADAAPSPREPASVSEYPARDFPKDSPSSPDGSLTRLMARSPSEEESRNGNITPLAGEKIPQTLKGASSGAASLLAADDWRDDEDIDPEELAWQIAKERREEERDAEMMRQRNSHDVDYDDLDADHPF
jgi:hypothetical protein